MVRASTVSAAASAESKFSISNFPESEREIFADGSSSNPRAANFSRMVDCVTGVGSAKGSALGCSFKPASRSNSELKFELTSSVRSTARFPPPSGSNRYSRSFLETFIPDKAASSRSELWKLFAWKWTLIFRRFPPENWNVSGSGISPVRRQVSSYAAITFRTAPSKFEPSMTTSGMMKSESRAGA